MNHAVTRSLLRLILTLMWIGGPLTLSALPIAARAAASVQQYTCPMHPHYLATDPDGQCPICGMDLVPADRAAAGPETGIAISPEIRQTIGVRTAPATVTPLIEQLRAFGTVEADEDRQSVVTARTEGWIETLAVRVRGAPVSRGEPLYTVFSPALLAAQQDHLSALAAGDAVRRNATRLRLRSLGMQPAVIAELASRRRVFDAVPVRAETSGIVEALNVRDGDYLRPGTELMRLQAYDEVWVLARIPESELSLIRTGAGVELSFPGTPGDTLSSTVDYIYPTLDRKTRTGEIRIRIDNASGALRPGAYADIRINLGSDPQLSVPQDAVLYDSRGALVILARDDGSFSSRSVQPGATANGRTAILDGLTEGERVVVSGQFLLDAEARLRQGLTRFERADNSSPPNAAESGDGVLFRGLRIGPQTLATFDHLTDMALYFHEALADGYTIRPEFLDPALNAGEILAQQFPSTALEPIVTNATATIREARRATSAESLAQALATLVSELEPWLLGGAATHYAAAGLSLFEDRATGRLWLQEGQAARNPYGRGAAERRSWPVADNDARPSSRPRTDAGGS